MCCQSSCVALFLRRIRGAADLIAGTGMSLLAELEKTGRIEFPRLNNSPETNPDWE